MAFPRLAWLAALPLIVATACSNPDAQNPPTPAARPTAQRPTPVPLEQPTTEPTPAVAASGASTPAAGPAGMRSPLPLSGEYAVTANLEDRTLSVVPIGLAKSVATIALDAGPLAVATAPDSDTALTVPDAADSNALTVASLNSSTVIGNVDAVARPIQVVRPPAEDSGVVVVLSSDNTLRAFNAGSRSLGPPVQLGPGPHTVSFGSGGVPATEHLYVTNAEAGNISVVDASATTIERTLAVGGTPVGVAETIDGRLWVADAAAGAVFQIDPADGHRISAIDVGGGLTGLASTRDGHYLVLSSSDPERALISVDLLMVAMDRRDAIVHQLAVPAGVLALATGAETTRAYATTGDGQLLYWDLIGISVVQSITVGKHPVALALGMVVPTGGVSPPSTDTAAAAGSGGAAVGTSGAGTSTTGQSAASSGLAASTWPTAATGAAATGAAAIAVPAAPTVGVSTAGASGLAVPGTSSPAGAPTATSSFSAPAPPLPAPTVGFTSPANPPTTPNQSSTTLGSTTPPGALTTSPPSGAANAATTTPPSGTAPGATRTAATPTVGTTPRPGGTAP